METEENDMKTIKEIIADLSGVEMGLMQGSVDFRFDPDAKAKKAAHPVEVMDDILSVCNYDVKHGKAPERGTVAKTLEKLKVFRDTYEVADLDAPLGDLSAWLLVTDPAE